MDTVPLSHSSKEIRNETRIWWKWEGTECNPIHTDFILKSFSDDYKNYFLRSRNYNTITCYSIPPSPSSLPSPTKKLYNYYKATLIFPIQVKIIFFPMLPNSIFNNSQSQYQNHINNSNHDYKKEKFLADVNLQEELFNVPETLHVNNLPLFYPPRLLGLKYTWCFSFPSQLYSHTPLNWFHQPDSDLLCSRSHFQLLTVHSSWLRGMALVEGVFRFESHWH